MMTAKMNSARGAIPVAMGLVLTSGMALAEDWADRIELGGFASANFHVTDEAQSFNGPENVGYDKQGSFNGTRYALNIRSFVNDRLSFRAQFFVAKEEDYVVHMDWFFGSLAVNDNLELRGGLIKFPVGLVNEYVDVGYSYLWLRAPAVIYSELGPPNGPQLVREAYTGGSILWNQSLGDWTLGADVFGGEVALEGATVRKSLGVTLRADWSDTVQFQFSTYEGTMMGVEQTDMANMMEGAKHRAILVGVKADWNNVIFYAEKGDVSMGDMKAMKGSNWYATLGYSLGDFTPHLTYQSLNQGEGEDKQAITTVGVRWDAMSNIAFKAEFSRIKTDAGVGLFQAGSPGSSVNMVGLGADLVF